MQDVEQLIARWAKDVGILDKSNPRKQLEKMTEEVNELETELIRMHTLELTGASDDEKEKARDKALMELGDVFVTAIVMAELLNVKPSTAQCLAYIKISKRKDTGSMKNGFFVKDGD